MWIIHQLWNYLQLSRRIYSHYKDYSDTHVHNEASIDDILESVCKCGSVCIKLCQWIIPSLETLYIDREQFNTLDYEKPRWLRKLYKVYENCPEHSLHYTYDKYEQVFHKPFIQDYRIIDCCGSGSIGQVYKIQSIHTQEYYAMKILHPNIDRDIRLFERLYRYIHGALCWWKGVHTLIPLCIPDFITSFREQSDFINEANNLLKLKHTYKSNPYLVFPEICILSKEILLMKYVEGHVFDDFKDESLFVKTKIFMMFYLFTRTMTLVHNFNHGDLHMSNWKVKRADNPLGYEIILYDFGFCWEMDHSRRYLARKAVDLFENMDTHSNKKDSDIFSEIMYDGIEHSHIHDTQELQELQDSINAYIQSSPYIGQCKGTLRINPTIIYKVIHEYCYQHHLYMTSELLQFVIIYTQLHLLCSKYGMASLKGDSTRDNVYKERYIDCLNYCKTYDVYPEYVEYIHQKLTEVSISRHSVFECSNNKEYHSFKSLALMQP